MTTRLYISMLAQLIIKDLYFPSGNVDLRYALNAEMDERDEKHKEFNLFTLNRVYHLRADSGASARQWVKQLQKVIFKSRNQGSNVKVLSYTISC
jgi:sterol 3beta-glucosyltransferase